MHLIFKIYAESQENVIILIGFRFILYPILVCLRETDLIKGFDI